MVSLTFVGQDRSSASETPTTF